jgi:hypothetical protein
MALARDGLVRRRWRGSAASAYAALALQVGIAAALIATGGFVTLLQLIGFTMGVLGCSASYFVVRRKRELPTSRFHPWADRVLRDEQRAVRAVGQDRPEGVPTAAAILVAITIVCRGAARVTPPSPRLTPERNADLRVRSRSIDATARGPLGRCAFY